MASESVRVDYSPRAVKLFNVLVMEIFHGDVSWLHANRTLRSLYQQHLADRSNSFHIENEYERSPCLHMLLAIRLTSQCREPTLWPIPYQLFHRVLSGDPGQAIVQPEDARRPGNPVINVVQEEIVPAFTSWNM